MSSLEGNELPQSYLRAADGVPPVRVLVVDDEPDRSVVVSTAPARPSSSRPPSSTSCASSCRTLAPW